MRPSRDATMLKLASTIAERSTCARRQVGCVLTNARGHVLSTGWNGVPAGQPHCSAESPFVSIDPANARRQVHVRVFMRWLSQQVRDCPWLPVGSSVR